MISTIKKNKPVILVEFNKNNFFKIKKLLKNYNSGYIFLKKII